VSVASLTPTPTPSELSTPVPEIPNDPRTAEETTSTSTVSVADYFRQKLREKAMARHVASGGSTELPEHSLARVKEEVKVDVGGVKWEGSRVTFGESQVDEDVKPDIKPDVKPTLAELAAVDTEAEDIKPSKEERRRAKEEKRKLKEEKRARKAAGQDTGSEVVIKEEILVKTEPIEPPKAKQEKRKRESGAEGSKEKREKHSA
jgi:Pin2-interacting protein X1